MIILNKGEKVNIKQCFNIAHVACLAVICQVLLNLSGGKFLLSLAAFICNFWNVFYESIKFSYNQGNRH